MSVAPGILNLTFPQGATWELSLTWTDSAGDPIDLTSCAAQMQVRASFDSAAVLSLTQGSGITLGGTAGTIELSASSTATAAILAQEYAYDLEVTFPNSKVNRVIQGSLTVTPEVSRI